MLKNKYNGMRSMMNSIYIYKQYYHELKGCPNESVTDYTLEMYKDLIKLENNNNIEMNIEAKRPYTTIELCETILQACHDDGHLKNIDLFITVNWSHEYDPVIVGALYFLNKYKINPMCFNIFDQGVIAPLTAIKIIQAFMQYSKVKKALLLCYDSISSILSYRCKINRPTHNSARIILLNSKLTKDALYEVKKIDLIENPNRNTINKSDVREVINITAENEYYSCPELFTPLFSMKNESEKHQLALIVQDSISNAVGMMELYKL